MSSAGRTTRPVLPASTAAVILSAVLLSCEVDGQWMSLSV